MSGGTRPPSREVETTLGGPTGDTHSGPTHGVIGSPVCVSVVRGGDGTDPG